MTFLNFAVIDSKSLEPSSVLNSLTAVVSIPPFLFEQAQQQIGPTLDTMVQYYDNLDSPEHQLSASSKLQLVSTYDPIEDSLNDLAESLEKFSRLLQTGTESEILETVRSLIQKESFYVVLFFSFDATLCYKVLQCIQHLNEFEKEQSKILDSFATVVIGNGNVVGFDMRKYYDIFSVLMLFNFKIVDLQKMLHKLRPLEIPAFTYQWMAIIADKRFIVKSIERAPTGFGVLVMDFMMTVCTLDPNSGREAFDKLYKALLRFILVLSHDFRNFVYDISIPLVTVIPLSFIQLRNIILSVAPEQTDRKPSPEMDELLDKTEFASSSFEQKNIPEHIKLMESKADNAYPIVMAYIKAVLAIKNDTGRVGTILSSTFSSASFEVSYLLANAIIDHVRFNNQETDHLRKIVVGLVASDLKVKEIFNVSELFMRVILERMSTPPPQPSALLVLVKDILNSKECMRSIGSCVADDILHALREAIA